MQPQFHPIGIYYDMPEDAYHADWSLSASGMKKLRVSPLNYWCNHPMNPDFEPEESDALLEGKAWHKRILEGKEAFYKLYAPKLDKADYPDALKSGDELKKKCKELGLKVTGTIPDLSIQIAECDSSMVGKLWHFISESYEYKHRGKTFLSAKTIKQIETAATTIEKNTQLKDALSGGKSEASIFWIDEETGVRMKRRVDYLKGDFICELKTFANQRNRTPEEAVGNAIAENNYFFDAMFSFNALPEVSKFHFLFLQKGNVPHIVMKNFCEFTKSGAENNYFAIAQSEYRKLINLYADCVKKYGYSRAWVDAPILTDLEDYELPLWAFK